MKIDSLNAIVLLVFLLLVGCNQSNKSCENGYFVEKNGMVIMEAESIPASKGWSRENSIKNYSGEGYLTWTDTTNVESNGQGLLSYNFKISKSGMYTVKIRNFHSCEDFTECNDVFVKVDDTEWRKNFNHSLSKWDWNSQQDIDHVFSNAEYQLEEGMHTLYLSGRSQYFSIDKIAIYHSDISDDSYKTAKLSQCIEY